MQVIIDALVADLLDAENVPIRNLMEELNPLTPLLSTGEMLVTLEDLYEALETLAWLTVLMAALRHILKRYESGPGTREG